ncbi:hypothetical protein VNO80_07100 [Phaseolus coccineus]|uniref:Uncharacterized protein n=1 Tax=Phaseolus coccineus TaxID=3886 RepID=A0AAN9RJA6_PHACN
MGMCPSPSSLSSTASFDSSTSTKECIVHGIVAAAAVGTCTYLSRFNNFRRRILGIIHNRYASSRVMNPLIEPEIIDGVVKTLRGDPDAVFSNAVTSLKPEDADDPNRVKCALDNCGNAIYLSRGLIPFNKSGKVNG